MLSVLVMALVQREQLYLISSRSLTGAATIFASNESRLCSSGCAVSGTGTSVMDVDPEHSGSSGSFSCFHEEAPPTKWFAPGDNVRLRNHQLGRGRIVPNASDRAGDSPNPQAPNVLRKPSAKSPAIYIYDVLFVKTVKNITAKSSALKFKSVKVTYAAVTKPQKGPQQAKIRAEKSTEKNKEMVPNKDQQSPKKKEEKLPDLQESSANRKDRPRSLRP
ncbi:hypothetical protein Trydic_g20880 [Trypoxylus dichotomus]